MHKIGILGAARIAPVAIIEPARRRQDVVVHAVASRRPGAADDYARQHLIAVAYDSYEALLADIEIDLVYNALPPADHYEWTIKALEAGKHVLCEKPFALNAGQARGMVEASARTGRRLVEAFHYRYHPVFLHLLALKQGGRLGAIRHIEASFDVEIPFSPQSIRHVPELGGGALMDLGCYPVHWVRSLMGSEPQVDSAAGTRNVLGADETMSARLSFAGGATADVSTNMSAGTKFNGRLVIEAERGTVEVSNPGLPHRGHYLVERLDGAPMVQHTLAAGTTYDYQLQAMLDAIDKGLPVPTEGADSIGNMAVIDAIYEKAGFRG